MSNAIDVQRLCGQYDRREISHSRFVEECTRLIAVTIRCSRVGIWLFEDAAPCRLLRCLGIYDRNRDRMAQVPNESSQQVGAYFEALERTGYVLAVDARTHPATAGFFSDQLSINGVRSLLASSFSVNGSLFGAFTCTQVQETKAWTPGDLAKLKRIGARASLALAGATQTAQTSLPMPLL
jgi:GAF domain-containing protein